MSQNTEQNVRTREEQVANAVKFARLQPQCVSEFLSCYLTPLLKEAEARGAEEQRRKDAEGRDTPSAYVRPDDFYNDERDDRCGPWSGDQIGEYTLPLYTHPANVAALEARVKELEGVCRHVVWTEEEHGLGSRGHDSAVQAACAALTREGGV